MIAEDKFVEIAGLICEPARAKMLWSLLDGRAYTAGELSLTAEVSPTSASNHLAKLLEAGLLKVETQGRHRYFRFSGPEVAYAVESLASLAKEELRTTGKKQPELIGIRYCRTCYDHLAGFVAIRMVEAFEDQKLISKTNSSFIISNKGWKWFEELGIKKEMMVNNRRPVLRPCLDWTERRPHLAGQLGALLFHSMMERKWFKKVRSSRELIVTPRGSQEIYQLLKIQV